MILRGFFLYMFHKNNYHSKKTHWKTKMTRILKLGTVDLNEISLMIKTGKIKTNQELLLQIDLAVEEIKKEKQRAFNMIDDIQKCKEHIYREPLKNSKTKIKVNFLSKPYTYCEKCGKLKQ